MVGALNTFWNRITAGLVAPTAEIHNKSDRPIFLIPISCPDVCDPRSLGKVMDGLARRIPAGGSIQVDSRKGVAAETQNESELGNLIEEVPSNQQELTVEVKALRTDIATLKNMLKRCDPLQANPNSSSSTNTFSPSK
ncbi:hypothetical protein NL676_008823 [Syzygium grande]|nr:hypothetical protein NL676_008823 [Syzygium grande]